MLFLLTLVFLPFPFNVWQGAFPLAGLLLGMLIRVFAPSSKKPRTARNKSILRPQLGNLSQRRPTRVKLLIGPPAGVEILAKGMSASS